MEALATAAYGAMTKAVMGPFPVATPSPLLNMIELRQDDQETTTAAPDGTCGLVAIPDGKCFVLPFFCSVKRLSTDTSMRRHHHGLVSRKRVHHVRLLLWLRELQRRHIRHRVPRQHRPHLSDFCDSDRRNLGLRNVVLVSSKTCLTAAWTVPPYETRLTQRPTQTVSKTAGRTAPPS
jgi:hypothetical protein